MFASSSRFLRGLALLTTLAGAGSVAHAFEGRIGMQVSEPNRPAHAIDYLVKESKLRFDAPRDAAQKGGAGGIIMDFAKAEMIILVDGHGRKMFFRRPLNAESAPNATHAAKERAAAPVMDPPVATGRSETIAGQIATEYRGKNSAGETFEFWLAKGLGNFAFPAGGNPMARGANAAPSPAWEKFVRDGGFFPLRVITRDSAGKEKSHLEVTKVEKLAVPDSTFSTDGYTEMNLPAFGGAGGGNPFAH